MQRSVAILLPGLLVAATGVGAGDLATAAFTGNTLGLAVLWAVPVGALLKFGLTEGIARWQLATGTTLLQGCVAHLGRPFQAVFLFYLVAWSIFVGSALMAACGVAFHALFPVAGAAGGKVLWGMVHSVAGLGLVLAGGFRLFERVMAGCVALMFATVLISAARLQPDPMGLITGLTLPSIPAAGGAGVGWTVALIGGVGGTLTVLCYGYWIREHGRTSPAALDACRIDLAAGYTMTAIFGLAMVVIGSAMAVPEAGTGAGLIATLGAHLEKTLGTGGSTLFLVGAWAAMFSSLLGVWQSVPLVFADFWTAAAGDDDTRRARRMAPSSLLYRGYLFFLALAPAAALQFEFRELQRAYAIVGAGFMPFLAIVLLLLNGRSALVGDAHRNRWRGSALLLLTLLFFLGFGALEIRQRLFGT